MDKGVGKENIARLIDEAIELELNAAALYALFHFAVHDDADFWWRLHQEERNHASLLSSLKETFLPADIYPDSLVLPALEQLQEENKKMKKLLEKFRGTPPGREEAFHVAVEIESSAGEIHFQKFAEHENESKVDKVFQDLIGSDKDHKERILKHMIEKGISPQ